MSTKKCRKIKRENKNEKVIRPRSQQKIIQRGANLFVKYFLIIKGFWTLSSRRSMNHADNKKKVKD